MDMTSAQKQEEEHKVVFKVEDLPWMKDFILECRTNNLNRVADIMAAELDKIKE
jgi:hypothetical protein